MDPATEQRSLAPSFTEDPLAWMQENRLRTVGMTQFRIVTGTIWLTGVTGSLAYQWTKPIPTSLKLIHSRVYAQAITLGALGVSAAVEMYSSETK